MRKLNIDEIAVMSDEELNTKSSKIRNLLSYRNRSENKKHLEIELCYIQREITIRERRKDAHSRFLRNRRAS